MVYILPNLFTEEERLHNADIQKFDKELKDYMPDSFIEDMNKMYAGMADVDFSLAEKYGYSYLYTDIDSVPEHLREMIEDQEFECEDVFVLSNAKIFKIQTYIYSSEGSGFFYMVIDTPIEEQIKNGTLLPNQQ